MVVDLDRRHLWLIPLVLCVLFLTVKPRQAGHDGEDSAGASAARMTMQLVGPAVISTPMAAASTVAVPPLAATASVTAAAAAVSTTLAEPPTPILTEEAVLVPELAPPTPVPASPEPAAPSQPVRLVIPAIGLDMAPVAVGLDEQGVPVVPKHDVGWYDRSATPGQNSNVVFWGHVLRWQDSPDVPAPFARVHELQPGAELILVTADGRQRNYRVSEQIQVRPDQVEYIDPTPSERVTLVSCIGANVVVDGTLTKEFRLLTIAEPAG